MSNKGGVQGSQVYAASSLTLIEVIFPLVKFQKFPAGAACGIPGYLEPLYGCENHITIMASYATPPTYTVPPPRAHSPPPHGLGTVALF